MNKEYMEALRLVSEWVEEGYRREDHLCKINADVLGALNKLYLCVTDEAPIQALGRIQDYAWSIMHDELEGQDELDPAWVWRVAHDAIHPCTCLWSVGKAHATDCPRFSEEYKVGKDKQPDPLLESLFLGDE